MASKPDASPASSPVAARLLDVDQAAVYLGISPWTVRSLIADKHLSTIRMPSVRHRGETTRRVLLDVRELDAAIERWREGAPAATTLPPNIPAHSESRRRGSST